MQQLRSETKDILARVEKVSGKPVQFLRDEKISLLATLHLARRGAPFHVLRYKPSNEPIDYFVAYQAGFVLRLFQNPPERRFDFATTDAGGPAIEQLLRATTGLHDTDQKMLEPFVGIIQQWALTQLRSLPIGMRIDCWIANEHPGLKDLQAAGISVQQQQNADILSQRFGNLTVPSHLLGPCAAYALLADRLLGVEKFVIPYLAAGVLDDGRELLRIWDEGPETPTYDGELVDRWADKLGMTGWYRWMPYIP